jgi:hypothetical protein
MSCELARLSARPAARPDVPRARIDNCRWFPCTTPPSLPCCPATAQGSGWSILDACFTPYLVRIARLSTPTLLVVGANTHSGNIATVPRVHRDCCEAYSRAEADSCQGRAESHPVQNFDGLTSRERCHSRGGRPHRLGRLSRPGALRVRSRALDPRPKLLQVCAGGNSLTPFQQNKIWQSIHQLVAIRVYGQPVLFAIELTAIRQHCGTT